MGGTAAEVDQIRAKLAEVDQQIDEWSRWETDSEKIAELAKRAGVETEIKEAAPVEPTPEKFVDKETSDMFAMKKENYGPIEGTWEIEQDPAVIAARAHLTAAIDSGEAADKITSLAEALDSARKEAQKGASLRAKNAVTKERIRKDTIESKHKMIDDIKKLKPDEMNKDLGDVVKEIKDYFLPKKDHPKQYGQKKTEIDLEALRAQLAEAEKTGDLASSIDLETFPKRLSKLKPEDLKQIHDALLNLQHIQKLRDKVQGAERDFERARLHDEADKNIAPPKTSILGPDVAKLKRNLHAYGNAVSASYDYNGEWVAGGKNNDIFRIIVRDPLAAEVNVEPRAFAWQKPVRNILQEKFGIDEIKTPLKWSNYWSKTFTEDGQTLTRDPKIFYEELFKLLQAYLGNRLNMPTAGITFDAVNQKLTEKGADLEILRKIRNLFSACDDAKFAFLQVDHRKMQGDLREFADVITYLERKKI